MEKTSRIGGFFKKTRKERQEAVCNFSQLCNKDLQVLKDNFCLKDDVANKISENIVSCLQVPLGVATNFIIDGKQVLVPMATEEASVIAGASYAAKLARPSGGFFTTTPKSIMTCQIQITNIKFVTSATAAVIKNKQYLLKAANSCDPTLVSLGGGAEDIKCKPLETSRGQMLIVLLHVQVKDAMGANIVNSMGEKISKDLVKITGGNLGIRIVTNFSPERIVTAQATWRREELGSQTIEKILDAYAFAQADSERCVTHNKGVMNGISAVALATSNDFRALEAGAHTFAFKNGFKPLTDYQKDLRGDLVGKIEIPLAVGVVGGSIGINPISKVCLKILGVKDSGQLAKIMASVGLAQNFAALRALACEGIKKGHMMLQSKNVAVSAGAPSIYVETIAQKMIMEGRVSLHRAKELIKKLNHNLTNINKQPEEVDISFAQGKSSD
jgi:hydroxymethylglutaryl-CoA reductase